MQNTKLLYHASGRLLNSACGKKISLSIIGKSGMKITVFTVKHLGNQDNSLEKELVLGSSEFLRMVLTHQNLLRSLMGTKVSTPRNKCSQEDFQTQHLEHVNFIWSREPYLLLPRGIPPVLHY